MHIKNRLDISDIIKDYDIKGMYLAGAIIQRLDRINQDLRNTNFNQCIIGTEGEICNLSGSDFRGCNFGRALFKGTIWFRHCDLRNVKFDKAVMPGAEFQYANAIGASFCDTVMKMGSKTAFKAKIDYKMFELWASYMQLEVKR